MLNIFSQSNKNNKSPTTGTVSTTNFRSYKDPTGEFDNNELEYGIWFMRHKVFLYRFLVVSLAVINVIIWGQSGWRWVQYFLGQSQDRAVTKASTQFINYQAVHSRYSPQPLQVENTTILLGGVSKYDAISEVANPNKSFVARFDYYFVIDGEKTESRHFFLLPEETGLVAHLGFSKSESPSDVKMVIENLAWSRVSPHVISKPLAWQAERLNFSIDNFNFSPPQSVDSPKVNVVTFELTNHSSFNYKEPHFIVGFYSGEVLVGVMPLMIAKFNSLETKKIDLRNFVANLVVTDAKIFPLIDVYNQEVYLPPAS